MNARALPLALALFASLAAFAAFAPRGLAAEGPSGHPIAPDDKPTARITIDYAQGGFILSASGGQGVLTFKGRKHPFKIGSLGVGGFGVSKLKGTGEVYYLTSLEDFSGAYFQARAGYAAGDGQGTHWLKNTNGVVIKLKTTAKGLALNLGADGLLLELGEMSGQAKGKAAKK
jgi:hypothetical protein